MHELPEKSREHVSESEAIPPVLERFLKTNGAFIERIRRELVELQVKPESCGTILNLPERLLERGADH